jgi:hypothetical protein
MLEAAGELLTFEAVGLLLVCLLERTELRVPDEGLGV